MIILDNQIVGGWLGDQLDKAGQSISDGIYNGFVAITDCIFNFIFWTSQAGIICCIIIYFASKDKKAVSWGWLFSIWYIVASVVKGNI
jgi:hypothetical protein